MAAGATAGIRRPSGWRRRPADALINVGNNGKKLQAAFAQIEDELRTQYAATYTPTNTKMDGTFRHLSMQCQGDGLKSRPAKATLRRRRSKSSVVCCLLKRPWFLVRTPPSKRSRVFGLIGVGGSPSFELRTD